MIIEGLEVVVVVLVKVKVVMVVEDLWSDDGGLQRHSVTFLQSSTPTWNEAALHSLEQIVQQIVNIDMYSLSIEQVYTLYIDIDVEQF